MNTCNRSKHLTFALCTMLTGMQIHVIIKMNTYILNNVLKLTTLISDINAIDYKLYLTLS